MKKFIFMAALLLIACFAMPAMAEVKVGGAYRLTATSYDPGYNSPNNSDSNYFQQRLRIPVTWTVNDNIKGYLRADWTEQNWFGYDSDPVAQRDKELEIDYAWVSITQNMFNIRAGLITTGYGMYSLYESYHEGIELNFDFSPVKVSLSYGKVAENGSSRDDGEFDDTNAYAVNLEYGTDLLTAGLIYGRVDANNVDIAQNIYDDSQYGYGIYVKIPVNNFVLAAELDYLGGDNGNGIDYEGLNFVADFSGSATETLFVGAALIYAQGTDDPSKEQLPFIRTDDSLIIFDFEGALAEDEGYFGGAASIFEFDTDSGVMGLALRASYAALDTLTLHLKLGYAQTEEDRNTALDSKTFIIGSADYAWMDNVTLSLGAGWVSPDYDDGRNDDPSLDIVARLGVDF